MDVERKRLSPCLALAVLLAVAAAWQSAGGRRVGPRPRIAPLLPDVNSAPESQLRLLPGIGPARAAAIADERAAGGPFRALSDLERVKGIGKVTVEGLKDLARAAAPSPGSSARSPPGRPPSAASEAGG